jgi:hydrogenase nickel incorporation protein HypB
MNPRIVEVRKNIMKKNDHAAAALRDRFRTKRMFVASLVSSPGAGKTAFLERTLMLARAERRVAALVGDLATEQDAERLRHSGAPVRQITTGTVCHLDAEMIERALENWPPDEVDWLFVENVGNLVCPASYDLGEHMRVVLLSVTEGEDKPLKYPTIFNTADVAIITKIDLAAAVEFDRQALVENIARVRPGLEVLEVSAKTGDGFDRWMALLDRRAAAATTTARVPADRALASPLAP